MISILIPVYNTDVTKLINSLVASAEKAAVPYQIIVLDDASDIAYKNNIQQVSHLSKVSYISLSENIGRAKIRNKLAQLANQPYLLFIDCDSKIVDEDNYIKNYIANTDKSSIISGGRIYESIASKEYTIHHQYGRKVESRPASKRNNNPYESFHSNNFMINARDFNQIKFNESIEGYGYEDLAFACRAKINNLSILHIDNPVIHASLDTNQAFLNKSYNAIVNLNFLSKNDQILNTKLLRTYERCKFLLKIIPFKQKIIYYLHKNLSKGKYSIYSLQLLKLLWFNKLQKKK
jgi:hypothetical protein